VNKKKKEKKGENKPVICELEEIYKNQMGGNDE
jgi:hypothetical protein